MSRASGYVRWCGVGWGRGAHERAHWEDSLAQQFGTIFSPTGTSTARSQSPTMNLATARCASSASRAAVGGHVGSPEQEIAMVGTLDLPQVAALQCPTQELIIVRGAGAELPVASAPVVDAWAYHGPLIEAFAARQAVAELPESQFEPDDLA